MKLRFLRGNISSTGGDWMRGLETGRMEAEALVCVLGVGMDLCTVTGLGNPIWIQLRDGGKWGVQVGTCCGVDVLGEVARRQEIMGTETRRRLERVTLGGPWPQGDC